MNDKIYFVTEQRLKDFTTILGNVDTKLFMPLIPTNADMWIKPRTGIFFFNHLLDTWNVDRENGTNNLTNEETELISLIQQSLIWRTASDIVITSHSQITNKGPQKQYGDNSTSLSITELGLLTRQYTSKAEFYDQRIVNYIWTCKNEKLFPQFTDKKNMGYNVDLYPNKKSSYIGITIL